MKYGVKLKVLKNKFASHPVFSNKSLKTRKKSYNSKIATNCYGKVTSKEFENICVSVIVSDSVFKSS